MPSCFKWYFANIAHACGYKVHKNQKYKKQRDKHRKKKKFK